MTNPPSPYGDPWDSEGSQQPDPGQGWQPLPRNPTVLHLRLVSHGRDTPTSSNRHKTSPTTIGSKRRCTPARQSTSTRPTIQTTQSLAPVTSLISGLIGFFIAWIPILGIAAWVFVGSPSYRDPRFETW